MIRIRTGSRLHFGLLSVSGRHTGPMKWQNQEGDATLWRRQFGGVGLMVENPGVELSAEFADAWSAEGPLAERALQVAQMYCYFEKIKDPVRIHIERTAPEHAGLGTGTQLCLAVARAIAELANISPYRQGSLSDPILCRGKRSGIGVHGFESGGFLMDGGRINDAGIAPLLVRHDFPKEWRIILVTPSGIQGIHGQPEIDAFADLAKLEKADRITQTLCCVALHYLLPALIERQLSEFGEALYDYNRRAGELFQPVQGGIYAHPRVEQIVGFLREAGAKGVGQSSWGPTVFAIVAAEQAAELSDWLINKKGITSNEITVTDALNRGAVVSA